MHKQTFEASLKLIPTLRMQQSLTILQAPIQELSSFILQQITENPIFDLSSLYSNLNNHYEPSDKNYNLEECNLPHEDSFLTYLKNQVLLSFKNHFDQYLANYIIDCLDDSGFLSISFEELSLLLSVPIDKISFLVSNIQNFHPKGFASNSIQNYWAFLLKHSQHHEAYTIVTNFYDELKDCQFHRIALKMHSTKETIIQILQSALKNFPWTPSEALKKIRKSKQLIHSPDIYIKHAKGTWDVFINNSNLPELRINTSYTNLPTNQPISTSEKSTLKHYISSAKWLIHSLQKREQTLIKLMRFIIPIQEKFLKGEQLHPEPLSPKSIAEELDLHESTVFRAIENKIISSSIGLFPLKNLCPRNLSSNSQHTQETIQTIIKTIIASETKPLSDEQISINIKKLGYICARRTVTKYRHRLKILPAHKRKVSL